MAIGTLLIIGGSLCSIYFLFYSTVVSSEFGGVHNIGLIQNRQLGIIAGIAAFIGGLILIAIEKQLPSGGSAVQDAKLQPTISGAKIVCWILGIGLVVVLIGSWLASVGRRSPKHIESFTAWFGEAAGGSPTSQAALHRKPIKVSHRTEARLSIERAG